MDLHNIISNSYPDVPAMLFALRLGGRGRRSYCRPAYTKYSKKPGFSEKHPLLYGLILGLIMAFILIAGSR